MSRLIKIAGWGVSPRANVIFVHGLGGHAYDTWRRKPDDDTFWPIWLATDVPGIRIFTLAYEAPPTNWLGTSMPLQDRAVNILECLLSEPGVKTGSIVFICHSLGGLIVKQVMLDLERQKETRPECADILQRVNRIVFAATPHTGSRHANLLDHLRFLAWPSTIARALVANDPTLRSINVAYRGLAQRRQDVLLHRIFYETQDTNAGRIVDEASADPGLPAHSNRRRSCFDRQARRSVGAALCANEGLHRRHPGFGRGSRFSRIIAFNSGSIRAVTQSRSQARQNRRDRACGAHRLQGRAGADPAAASNRSTGNRK
ncbi:hypothetical protein [Methylocystis sp.]|uniref:esterase/lipase family protein n=1 Tax=Methylocystis sp. TaxID=1911079 RepID=UPI0025F5CE08|nr:hypothetical protein [Methylocystis sp.]